MHTSKQLMGIEHKIEQIQGQKKHHRPKVILIYPSGQNKERIQERA